MAKDTGISWCDHTANFWWGCMKVSDGCKNCYAETLSKRYGKSIWGPASITDRELKKAVWKDLLKWDKQASTDGVRRRVFVSSMSDFLENHPQVEQWREDAMDIISDLKSLDVLLLTKRPENAGFFLARWYKKWPSHVWMGTSIENQYMADQRIPALIDIPANIHFLSVEPMLEQIDLSFSDDIEWVICGGESGAKCRQFEWDWARSLRDQVDDASAAFWMKQGGGHPNPRHDYVDIPADLQIRELPEKVTL